MKHIWVVRYIHRHGDDAVFFKNKANAKKHYKHLKETEYEEDREEELYLFKEELLDFLYE